MKLGALLVTLLLGSVALADTTTYDVEGMHCGSCAKAIKAEVCKMPGLEKCDVSVGKVMITPKSGINISQDQIQAAITKAAAKDGDDYKITGSHKSK